MGLCSATQICQRLTNPVMFIYKSFGFNLINYLDDFAGAEVPAKLQKAFDELKMLLLSCGLEESSYKACPPST